MNLLILERIVNMENVMSFYNKAMKIYNLLGDTRGRHSYYSEFDGSLNFRYKSATYIDCKITPVEDKYKIKISKSINIATAIILYEVENVDGKDLYNTFHDIIKYLDKEWMEWNKEWRGLGQVIQKGK